MSAGNEEVNTQRFQSSIGTSSSSLPKQHQPPAPSSPFLMNQLDIPQLNVQQFRGQFRQQASPNAGLDITGRRAGIPPSHPQIPPVSPYSQIPLGRPQAGIQNFSTSPSPAHNRSLSQPSFFALDSLPPLSPSPYRDLAQSSIPDQTEATTLSAQLTLLQRDSAGLTSQNNELKFRLQAMEQQAQLRDALNEALTAEVQRLKLATAELAGDTSKFQQLSISPQMFQLRQQQMAQMQNQQQKQSQQSNGIGSAKNESNK
ncbi:Basic-leucine zipper (bZIP) transcription factor family protein [Striga hermonthica]|uniref:Basic-leucine zipper (BZIP) transcription factor family protein n=1 Tax=Striga hermonthica TaxID=68872 RepID=A0A9N7R2V0_STRHE|nr:Basic-leucine zipper (bZIP) transcription factor family protein [Striga hermonthica]